jgi:ribosomal protein S18 acetylase RimI-like enzyme
MLAALAQELGTAAQCASTEAVIRRYGHGPQARFCTLIGETEAEAPVGLALYFPHFSTTRGQPGAYVQDLWTAPDLRGQGVGRALLAAVATASARDWGAAYLTLSVHRRNDAAAQFYAGLGFEAATGEHAVFLEQDGVTRLVAPRKATA